MRKILYALLIVCMVTLLCACSSSDVPDVFDPDIPGVTVFADGKMEYSVIVGLHSSDLVYNFADVFDSLSGTKATRKNDRWEETPLEVLVGPTERAFSVSLTEELSALSSESEFHYIIAEQDGKVAVIADNEIGYQYLADRIREVYCRDGVMKVPVGCHDLQTVTLDEYHKSEYYALELKKEEKREQIRKANEEKKEKQKQEELERMRKMAQNFNSEDFGSRTAFPTDLYGKPAVYPGKSHPRVLFTENSIETVRANFTAAENKAAYDRYMERSEQLCLGILEKTDGTKHNMDYNVLENIESMAFRYAMTGEAIYGYQAITAIKNVILTLDIPEGTLGDSCRAYGYVMYIAGCVYDWCYDLLSDECKQQIINGCVTLMGTEMEIGVPPVKQGAVYSHGTEAQLLRDWLTFAIACYDEAPDIYELVAGRIFTDYVDASNYFFASENHWEGSDYGPYRLHFSLYTQLLFDRMTDGECAVFSDDMQDVATTFLHYIRPDNQALRIGDFWSDIHTQYGFSHYAMVMFYAGNYYKDPVLKNFAWQHLNQFTKFATSNNSLSPVMLLTLNDPTVPLEDHHTISLTRLTKTPLVSAFARSSWTDPDSVMVYMTMNKSFSGGHGHMDLGSFQIFYKGILASDSGKYSSWGDPHHKGYTMQTVSSNSLLVYNPNLSEMKTGNFVYSGGQSIVYERVAIPETLDKILALPSQNQCSLLGAANAEKDGVYQYTYLAGDMTAAYDAETVDEVTRYMLSAATGNEEYPLVFATYDRITSDDASYRKSALIHVQEEPVITEDGFAIVTNTGNGSSGKMIVQSVMTETDYTLIGGEGRKYWLYDKNADTDDTTVEGAIEEYGWGRIEISPAAEAKTDYLLTLMYVTDAGNTAAPVKAADISTDMLAGAQIFGRALLFPRKDMLLASELTFTLAGDEETECYLTGMQSGTWTITDSAGSRTAEVVEGENILTFKAAGNVTVTPVK